VADTPRYCTVAELKAKGITSSDEDILTAILCAQEHIDTYCRRIFSPVELLIDMDGSGHDTLFLDDYPIVEITAITYEDGNYGSSTYTVDTTADIIVAEEEGYIVHRTLIWPAGDRNIHIEGTFGEEETPVRIKEICKKLAMAGGYPGATPLEGGEELKDPGLQSETIQGYTYSRRTVKGTLPGMSSGDGGIDLVLNTYRRAPIMKAIGRRDVVYNPDQLRLQRIIGDSE
jgi:hypothetical protein